jgi:hypothetical protein
MVEIQNGFSSALLISYKYLSVAHPNQKCAGKENPRNLAQVSQVGTLQNDHTEQKEGCIGKTKYCCPK